MRKEKTMLNASQNVDLINKNSVARKQNFEYEKKEGKKMIATQIDNFIQLDRKRQEFLVKINSLNEKILNADTKGQFGNYYTYVEKKKDVEVNNKHILEQQDIAT